MNLREKIEKEITEKEITEKNDKVSKSKSRTWI